MQQPAARLVALFPAFASSALLLLGGCDSPSPKSEASDAGTDASVDTGLSDSGAPADTSQDAAVDTGEPAPEGSCWIDGLPELRCPAQPQGLRPTDCSSGAIADGSGFAAGTGACLAAPPRLCNLEGCDTLPVGSLPSDCPSGRIVEDAGFAPGTGPCLPAMRDWNCPVGWQPSDATLDEAGEPLPGTEQTPFLLCLPPESPVGCPAGTIAVAGDEACRPLGAACPSEAQRWPSDASLRALAPGFDGPIVFVAPDGTGPGTRLEPMSLNEATYPFSAVPTGAIIALALGDYPDLVDLDDGVALVGSCVGGTRLVSPAPYIDVGAVSLRGTLPSLVANLTFDTAGNGLVVRGDLAGAPLHIAHDVEVARAFHRGVAVTEGGRLQANSLRISGVTLDPDPIYLESGVLSGGGLVATYGAELQGEDILIEQVEHAGLWVDAPDGTPTQVTLSGLTVDTPGRHSGFRWATGVTLLGGTTTTLRDLTLRNAPLFASTNRLFLDTESAPVSLIVERGSLQGSQPELLDAITLSDVDATLSDLSVQDVPGAALSAFGGALQLTQFVADRCATDLSAGAAVVLDSVAARVERAAVRQTEGTAFVTGDTGSLGVGTSVSELFIARSPYGLVAAGDLTATDLLVVESSVLGLELFGGTIDVEALLVAGSGQTGIYAQPDVSPFAVGLRHVTLLGGRDGLQLTLPWDRGGDEPELLLDTALLRDQQGIALVVDRGLLRLREVVVSNARGSALSLWSAAADAIGFAASEGDAAAPEDAPPLLDLSFAEATFERLTVRHNLQPAGVFYDSKVTLSDGFVQPITLAEGGLSAARGLSLESGTQLRLLDSQLEATAEVALFVDATSGLDAERVRLIDNADSLVAVGGRLALRDVSLSRPLLAATPDGLALLGDGFGRLYLEGSELTATALQSEAPIQLVAGTVAAFEGLVLRSPPEIPEVPLLLLEGGATATVAAAAFERAAIVQTAGSELAISDAVFRSPAGGWRLQGAEGLPSTGEGTRLVLDGSPLEPILDEGLPQDGLVVEPNGSLTLSDATIRGFARSGLYLTGADSSLRGERMLVEKTGPDAASAELLSTSELGNVTALRSEDGALELREVTLRENLSAGLHLRGPTATLIFEGLVIEEAEPVEDETGQAIYGDGLVMGDGATLEGSRLTVSGNPRCGIQLYGEAASLAIDGATIRRNLIGINLMGSGFTRADIAASIRDERYEQNGLDLGNTELELPDLSAALSEFVAPAPNDATALGTGREDCYNGIDDNADDAIDCEDQQCANRAGCVIRP
jgi:hypothetical protein